ncbi:MAG TPA: hypothetical protein VFA41_17830 [Ktedonobacteraceae bacterium]|nr:hypothetical protein [Ktedonobacteraceae bacterium]
MATNLEDWETQQEAKRAAARKEQPLSFLQGGGAAASRREEEERRLTDALAHEAEERRKQVVSSILKALRSAYFPDEITYFREMLQKIRLTPGEEAELRDVLAEKIR